MVLDNAKWFFVVLGGSGWFFLVLNGSLWFSVTLGGFFCGFFCKDTLEIKLKN